MKNSTSAPVVAVAFSLALGMFLLSSVFAVVVPVVDAGNGNGEKKLPTTVAADGNMNNNKGEEEGGVALLETFSPNAPQPPKGSRARMPPYETSTVITSSPDSPPSQRTTGTVVGNGESKPKEKKRNSGNPRRQKSGEEEGEEEGARREEGKGKRHSRPEDGKGKHQRSVSGVSPSMIVTSSVVPTPPPPPPPTTTMIPSTTTTSPASLVWAHVKRQADLESITKEEWTLARPQDIAAVDPLLLAAFANGGGDVRSSRGGGGGGNSLSRTNDFATELIKGCSFFTRCCRGIAWESFTRFNTESVVSRLDALCLHDIHAAQQRQEKKQRRVTPLTKEELLALRPESVASFDLQHWKEFPPTLCAELTPLQLAAIHSAPTPGTTGSPSSPSTSVTGAKAFCSALTPACAVMLAEGKRDQQQQQGKGEKATATGGVSSSSHSDNPLHENPNDSHSDATTTAGTGISGRDREGDVLALVAHMCGIDQLHPNGADSTHRYSNAGKQRHQHRHHGEAKIEKKGEDRSSSSSASLMMDSDVPHNTAEVVLTLLCSDCDKFRVLEVCQYRNAQQRSRVTAGSSATATAPQDFLQRHPCGTVAPTPTPISGDGDTNNEQRGGGKHSSKEENEKEGGEKHSNNPTRTEGVPQQEGESLAAKVEGEYGSLKRTVVRNYNSAANSGEGNLTLVGLVVVLCAIVLYIARLRRGSVQSRTINPSSSTSQPGPPSTGNRSGTRRGYQDLH